MRDTHVSRRGFIVWGTLLLVFVLPPFLDAREVKLAPTPPMGWNSWDAYGTTVTENEVKANADTMAAVLKPYGWQYIVIDIQWYEPNAKAHGYRPNAQLVMDPNGRLIPALNRFPSSANGNGFRPLADYVHSKGLKFGIHILRGIPRPDVCSIECHSNNGPFDGSTRIARFGEKGDPAYMRRCLPIMDLPSSPTKLLRKEVLYVLHLPS
jgi:hypothetical protein